MIKAVGLAFDSATRDWTKEVVYEARTLEEAKNWIKFNRDFMKGLQVVEEERNTPNCYIGVVANNEDGARAIGLEKVHTQMGKLVHKEEPVEEGEQPIWVFEAVADVLDDVEDMLSDHFELEGLEDMPYEQV